MNSEQTGLNKYISSTGFCSRREADKLIEQARVTINGKLVITSVPVKPGDVVEVDGEPLNKSKSRPVYIAFNKPVGVTSTTDPKDKTNIIYFIGHPKRIFPVGRLDKDSDGLIFLTNDGDIVNKILRASNHHEKEYIVSVDKAITPDFIKQMSNGVPILDTVTNKCFVRQEGGRRFRIILTQGLNRQVRRMCEYLGYKVVSLTRVRIMNVSLGNLPVGKWRYFSAPEIDKLNELVAESSKVNTESRKKVKKPLPQPPENIEVEETEEDDRDLQEWIEKANKPKSSKKTSYSDFRKQAGRKGKEGGVFEAGRRDANTGKAQKPRSGEKRSADVPSRKKGPGAKPGASASRSASSRPSTSKQQSVGKAKGSASANGNRGTTAKKKR